VIRVAVLDAPADVLCLRVLVTGVRTVERLVPLVPGRGASVLLEGLPTGPVALVEQAFPLQCGQVTDASAATWSSDPLNLHLVAGVVQDVTVVLRPNGRIRATSDFQPDPAGGPGVAGPDAAVVMVLDQLAAEIAVLRAPALDADTRARLARSLGTARALFLAGHVCPAVTALGDVIAEARALRRRAGGAEAGEYLLARGWLARGLAAGRTADPACAGLALDREPAVALGDSDHQRLAARIALPSPRLRPVRRGGEAWTDVSIEGARPLGDGRFGLPAVPIYHRLVAVPIGAGIAVSARPALGESLAVNLLPLQEETPMLSPDDFSDELPPDSVFVEPPFVKNETAYASDAAFPPEVCTVTLVGQFRDLRVADLACAVGRYHAASDRLDLYTGVDVEITFPPTAATPTGAAPAAVSGAFVTERSLSPFESAPQAYTGTVLNRAAVARAVAEVVPGALTCTGEELAIMAGPGLRPAAEVLAAWKNAKGILTRVFDVNDGPGPGPDTAAEIKALVGTRYDNCTVRPSYVLLFGDAEYVPTFYPTNPVYPDTVIASDLPYAMHAQFKGDKGLDFAVARLPVDEPQAAAVVAKIVKYESDPPKQFGGSGSFYNNAAIASQFACCQPDQVDGTDAGWFIPTVEDVRTRLLPYLGGVQRIYTKTTEGGYMGAGVPKFYSNGTPLPPDLAAPFPWSGNTGEITSAFNAGRVLMVHLDHGGKSGWSHPNFVKTHAEALANGELLPVVLGFNCSSGSFDNETDGPPNEPSDPTAADFVSFTEALIRNPAGGAVGSIAGTRTTYGHGNIMIRGEIDSAFPGVDSGFGSSQPNSRLGDMLNHGRMYMLTYWGASTNTDRHFLLYLAYGDPTLEMWTQSPYRLPDLSDEIEFVPDFLIIPYAVEGAVITATQPGAHGPEPLGRAVVRGGLARLPLLGARSAGAPLQLAASLSNAVSAGLTIAGGR
jgi:hypothetical protein